MQQKEQEIETEITSTCTHHLHDYASAQDVHPFCFIKL